MKLGSVFFLLGVCCFAANGQAEDPDWLSLLRQGNHEQLADRLDKGLNPDQRLPDQSLPLAWAIELQDADTVRLLLQHGAKTEDRTPGANPFQPMIVACQHGNNAILSLLLDAGADVNITGPEGIPALSICAGHAPTAVVEQMLDLGAEADHADMNGQTPLMWAAFNSRLDTLNLLIERGADVNRQTRSGFTSLLFAVKSADSETAQAIVRSGGDTSHITPDGTTLVQLAMYQQNHGFAEWLVAQGADLKAYDRNGRQLIHAAVLANQPRLVELLLAKGADVNALTGSSIVKWKYESNFRPGAYEFPPTPPLALAIQQNAPLLMTGLADAGADVAWRDARGNNIVLLASRESPETLAAALRLAPDANVQNNNGKTPLHLVLRGLAGADRDARLRILAAHGADPSVPDNDGVTAAEMAAAEDFRGHTLFTRLFPNTLDDTASDTANQEIQL